MKQHRAKLDGAIRKGFLEEVMFRWNPREPVGQGVQLKTERQMRGDHVWISWVKKECGTSEGWKGVECGWRAEGEWARTGDEVAQPPGPLESLKDFSNENLSRYCNCFMTSSSPCMHRQQMKVSRIIKKSLLFPSTVAQVSVKVCVCWGWSHWDWLPSLI